MENKAPKKPQGWLMLFLVSLVAALTLAGTNELTKDAIAQRALEEAEAARRAVLHNAENFEQMQLSESGNIDNGYRGLKEGQTVGYVAQTTVRGYAGDIEVIIGMDLDGKLTGISVGGPKFSETVGLGDKAKAPAFTDQFNGLSMPVKLQENVDAISGATITSTAVVLGVNQAGEYLTTIISSGEGK